MYADWLLAPISVTSTDLLRLFVITFFSLLLFLAFFYGTFIGWFFNGKENRTELSKEPTRIIGGLGVLTVSLVAHNPYIYALALFIGGLLIASEKFMINLAAIFNSDSKNVYKISEKWSEASSLQVEQKQVDEANEAASIDEINTISDKTTPKKVRELDNNFETTANEKLAAIKSIEKIVLEYLSTLVTTQRLVFKKYVEERSTNAGVKRIFDGIVVNRGNNKVLLGVEVIFREKLSPPVLRISIRNAVRHMKSSFPLLIVVVSKNFDSWNEETIRQYKQSLKRQYPDVNIAFYKISEQNVDAIDENDLLSLLRDF